MDQGPTKFTLFPIRHHGPGSARSLRQGLETLKPDCLLIEGPPDADAALPLAASDGMEPPVALLIYPPDQPSRAVYYPFAVFSPEWQAIQYGLERKTPIRFMDLPQTHCLAIEAAKAEEDAQAQAKAQSEETSNDPEEGEESESQPPGEQPLDLQDPLAALAEAAGYSDTERWWEQMVEHRQDSSEVFAAVLEAMTALREGGALSGPAARDPERDARREAWMRQTIRAALEAGCERIAVVCGAWHAPALTTLSATSEDAALLKGLPKQKVQATWVPWTYGRLALASGYGAGIESPGWYDFLWAVRPPSARRGASRKSPSDGRVIATRWLSKVARLLRGQDLEASSAGVIEAVRLAETLSALRGRPLPGLPELNEASQTVLCHGDILPLRLIRERLIINDRLGKVPDDTPTVPLQQDLEREQKRLRLSPEAGQRVLDLDLRRETDLGRSLLLHRLGLLGIPWGEPERAEGKKGTFHELWRLQWEPEFAVQLIEAALWGNTVVSAAAAFAKHTADEAADLRSLTECLDKTILAALPEAVDHVVSRLRNQAAVATDVGQLLSALPPLAQVLRYGNVRQTDAVMVAGVVDSIVERASIGLPGACASLNDEAAAALFEQISQADAAIVLLENHDHRASWHGALRQVADLSGGHGLVNGRCARLLFEAQVIDAPEAARRLGWALSTAAEPAHAAAWVEGLLRSSGLLLLHDEKLWQVLDDWVTALQPDAFTATLPLLRRTTSTFTSPERRQLGERAARGSARGRPQARSRADFDEARAIQALPLVAQLLGLRWPEGGGKQESGNSQTKDPAP